MPRQRPLGAHPSERPNWGSMNEGQRRYAVEQYQLARVRRGLDIDHPIPGDRPAEAEVTESDPIEPNEADNNPGEEELDEILDRDFDQDDIDEVIRELDPRMGDVEMQNVSSSVGSSKRAGDTAAPSGSKKARTSSRTTIPGRARAESGGGGVSGASEGIIEIPRPLNDDSFYTKHFIKQHKFFTFGFASKIISKPIAAVLSQYPAHTQYFMTSSLAEIPVHIPALYLNQSEYNLLPNGAHIKSVKVTVVQRNPVLQFETNASSSQLATLNQNKNGIYAIGLNKTGYGLNRHYSEFMPAETMIPTNVSPPLYGVSVTPAYQGLVSDLYGVINTDPNFADVTPKHQFGMYTTLKNYWCTTTTSLDVNGWPNLQTKTQEWDAANSVGMPICEYSYTPQMGILKPPQRAIWTGLPFRTTNNYFRGTGQEGPEQITKTCAATGFVTAVDYVPRGKTSSISVQNILTPIEQGQFQSIGVGGNMNPKVQPSLHVGIMPGPALSSGSLTSDLSNSTFTDIRCYYDVTCEMVVGWRERTDRPFASFYNVAPGEELYQAAASAQDPNGSVWANAYGSAVVPVA